MTMLEDLREVVRVLELQKQMNAEKEFATARYWSRKVDSLSSSLIRTYAEQIERDARELAELRQYFKVNVPCTCLWSGHIGMRADGTHYGESKITYKCARCRILDAAMHKEGE